MIRKTLVADLVRLFVVFIPLSACVILIRNSEVTGSLWVYLLVGVIALGVWHSKKWPTGAAECLKLSLTSVLVGALFYAADTLIAHFERPAIPLWKVGTTAGSAFGFIATIAVCPLLTTIALAGALRALCLQSESI